MPLIERYIAVGCQYRMSGVGRELTKKAIKDNLQRMEKFIEMGYEQFSYSFPIKLMCLPEYALSGYPAHN